jgi:hypothetical protein
VLLLFFSTVLFLIWFGFNKRIVFFSFLLSVSDKSVVLIQLWCPCFIIITRSANTYCYYSVQKIIPSFK